MEDSYAVLEWIAAEAASLGIDPARLAVGGDSAGEIENALAMLARKRLGSKQVEQAEPVTQRKSRRPKKAEKKSKKAKKKTTGLMRIFNLGAA